MISSKAQLTQIGSLLGLTATGSAPWSRGSDYVVPFMIQRMYRESVHTWLPRHFLFAGNSSLICCLGLSIFGYCNAKSRRILLYASRLTLTPVFSVLSPSSPMVWNYQPYRVIAVMFPCFSRTFSPALVGKTLLHPTWNRLGFGYYFPWNSLGLYGLNYPRSQTSMRNLDLPWMILMFGLGAVLWLFLDINFDPIWQFAKAPLAKEGKSISYYRK